VKKLLIGFTVLALLAFFVGITTHDASAQKKKCTTIQSGLLKASDGTVITTGYNKWGYNYQANLFNGYYCDAYQDAAWCQAYKQDKLAMKWNDAWLSNQDCDGDGLLDRHFGFQTYIGSGAWLTNHISGTYLDDYGKECQWMEFYKIVAVPANAVLTDGTWFVNNKELGPVIWGEFAIVQDVYNDPCGGFHGKQYISPMGPGLGKWKQ
jgi:hypothetical protein